jgi:hypothetical protein
MAEHCHMRLVNGSLGVGTTTPSERLHIGGNVRYDGQLSKLDVGDGFQATVRAADFLFWNSSRHGSPGRTLVDFTDTLVFNFGPDWTNTVINGNVALDWNGRNDGNLNFGSDATRQASVPCPCSLASLTPSGRLAFERTDVQPGQVGGDDTPLPQPTEPDLAGAPAI